MLALDYVLQLPGLYRALSVSFGSEMRELVSTLFLLGALYLNVRVQTSFLKEGAVVWEGALPCGRWDCECVFKCQCILGMLLCCSVSWRSRCSPGLLVCGTACASWTTVSRMGTQVAFTATMSPTSHCFDPFTSNVPISYTEISFNYGNGYNPALGTHTQSYLGQPSIHFNTSIPLLPLPPRGFTPPFSAYSNVGKVGQRLYHKLQLMRNGEVVRLPVLVPLDRGSQVYVELLSGRQLCGDLSGQNKFSGYLLYPTEA
ncbi:unnamed protein product [Coregonus sp. 'balchen']|nr:unnamed protein product [Coregonus sp. 'balchen']